MSKRHKLNPLIVLAVRKKGYLRQGLVYAQCDTSQGACLIAATPELAQEMLGLLPDLLRTDGAIPIRRNAH